MIQRIIRFVLLAACAGSMTAQTVQQSRVTFDEVKGQSQPIHVSFYTGEYWGTVTPEGGFLDVFNGTFYTNCSCVPGDLTTVYGMIAGYTSSSLSVSLGPAPVASAHFKLINGADRADTYAITTQHHYVVTVDGTPNDRYYLTRQTQTVPALGSVEVEVESGDIQTFTVQTTSETFNKGHWSAFVDDVEWSFAKNDTADRFFVQFEIATDPAAPYVVEKEIPSDNVVKAQLSLGSIFSPRIVKKHTVNGDTTVVPVVSVYSQSANTVAPALETELNLWDETTTLPLSNDASAATTLKYVAVHLGQTDFEMFPASESQPRVTLHLSIVRPPSLGGSNNEWDQKFIGAAHERGIPPQFLKGQARQESNFNESEFRYEPCTADLTYISRGVRDIEKTPYKLYEMDDIRSDQGLSSTVDLRNRYYIVGADGVRRKLRHSDADVTAGDIWYANDKWPPGGKHGQNWSSNACPALDSFLEDHSLEEVPSLLLSFSAQTPTSSSYGLLQVMYATAMQYRWSVDDPENITQKSYSPRYLRDTTESLNLKNGGSLPVGGAEDVQRYFDWYWRLPNFVSFPDQEEFYDSFENPLRMYTGGGVKDYGVKIMEQWQFDYLPQQPSAIFQ